MDYFSTLGMSQGPFVTQAFLDDPFTPIMRAILGDGKESSFFFCMQFISELSFPIKSSPIATRTFYILI